MKLQSLYPLWISLLVAICVNGNANEKSGKQDASIAIITCGSSGVGKSFIDNVIVGKEVFVHGYQPSSVTRETESVVTNLNGNLATVYNIPGLIESNKENVALNKVEIEKAFLGKYFLHIQPTLIPI